MPFAAVPLSHDVHAGPQRDAPEMRQLFLRLAAKRVWEAIGRGEYELTDAIRELAQSGKVRAGRAVKALELIGEWADVRDPETVARLNE